MEFVLRCNSLQCRSELGDLAVVTTCSHIFCLECADKLGLAHATTAHRICPACKINLPNPDDAVRTQLNPTEDYKTSVLSGLSPAIITECAGRALTFWSYQSSQEIVYQDFLAKSLTERYGDLNAQLDQIINDANSQIDSLNQKLQGMQIEQDRLRHENNTLQNDLKERKRKHDQTQKLYDKIKHKEMAAATQHAAYDTADEILNANHAPDGFPPGLYGSGNDNSQESLHSLPMGPPLRRPGTNYPAQTPRTRRSTDNMMTPGSHRQPLGPASQVPGSGLRVTAHLNNWQGHSNPARVPLSSINENVQGRPHGSHAPGVSATMRQGTPQASRSAKWGAAHGSFV